MSSLADSFGRFSRVVFSYYGISKGRRSKVLFRCVEDCGKIGNVVRMMWLVERPPNNVRWAAAGVI